MNPPDIPVVFFWCFMKVRSLTGFNQLARPRMDGIEAGGIVGAGVADICRMFVGQNVPPVAVANRMNRVQKEVR
jgi:hypothetical protein